MPSRLTILLVNKDNKMGTAQMAELGQVSPPAIRLPDDISIARLHGLACVDCGAVARRLRPAGIGTHQGREWPVVACPQHIARHRPSSHPSLEGEEDLAMGVPT